jgi:hypothetical protein
MIEYQNLYAATIAANKIFCIKCAKFNRVEYEVLNDFYQAVLYKWSFLKGFFNNMLEKFDVLVLYIGL